MFSIKDFEFTAANGTVSYLVHTMEVGNRIEVDYHINDRTVHRVKNNTWVIPETKHFVGVIQAFHSEVTNSNIKIIEGYKKNFRNDYDRQWAIYHDKNIRKMITVMDISTREFVRKWPSFPDVLDQAIYPVSCQP